MSTDLMVGSDAALNGGIQQENKSGLLSNMGGADMMRQVTMILALAVCLALAVKFDENRCQILELVLKCAKNELSHNKKVN